MSARQQLGAGVTGFVLIGVYSWIMTTTSGAASWAWVILVAAIVLLASTARSVATQREGNRGG